MLALCFALGWLSLTFGIGAMQRGDTLLTIVWFGIVAIEGYLVVLFARRIQHERTDEEGRAPDLDLRAMIIMTTAGCVLFALLSVDAALADNTAVAYADGIIFIGLCICLGFLTSLAGQRAREARARYVPPPPPEDDANWSSYAAEVSRDDEDGAR